MNHPAHSIPLLSLRGAQATRQSSDCVAPRPPLHTLSLRGAQATRQSSGTMGQPPHRLGIPYDASGWIATSVLCETFLAMTKSEEIGLPRPTGLAMTTQGDTPENRDASHLAHSRPHRCHCEERSDAVIQSNHPTSPATAIRRNNQVTYFLSSAKALDCMP